MTIKTNVKAGGDGINHNQPGLGVSATNGIVLKTGVRAGSVPSGKDPPAGYNHNQRGLEVSATSGVDLKTGVRGGGVSATNGIVLKTGLRAGLVPTGGKDPPAGYNHNQRGLAVKSTVKAGGILVDERSRR